MQSILGQLSEAKYLAVDDNELYRSIVRFLFIQYEKFRYQVSRKEILEHLRTIAQFVDLEDSNLEYHLTMLEVWGNVIARQDNRHAKSIAEFNKKHFRYQLSSLTVALERTLAEWETSLKTSRGGLDSNTFERLYTASDRLIKNHSIMNNEELDALWEEMFYYFKELSQRAIDFFAKAEDMDKIVADDTEKFLEQKGVFHEYLQSFIRTLQVRGLAIEGLVKEINITALDTILERLIQFRIYEKPVWGQTVTADSLHGSLLRQWDGFRIWFSSSSEDSEMNRLQQQSVDTIRKVTRMVVRLGERQSFKADRKHDYLYLAKKFIQTSDLEEAHKLSASVFGVMKTRHFLGIDHPSEQILSLWEGSPNKQTTKPFHQRGGLGKKSAGEVLDRTEEKKALLREREEEGRFEEELLRMLLLHERLTIEDFGSIHPKMRRVLLNWLVKTHFQEGVKTGVARGVGYTISKRSRNDVQLDCLDGVLTMPDYEIALRGVGNGGSSTGV